MEHESFENPVIAEVLSRYFVSIKVDREERPDVDRVYMTFVQATTGSGGWPMSVWLTPTLEPFYGGTYFPPEARWGRPGFVEILEEIARVWREEQPKVEQSAVTIMGRLQSMRSTGEPGGVPDAGVLGRTVGEFASSFDPRRGGFGGAPKFPRPSEMLFLLREHARTGAANARDMVLVTLRAMALGGMRDHLGGGFHRYSVDADWRVPHFEKMLYDQAQLVLAYAEAAQITGDRFYADVALDTLDYVRRDLTSPGGGFFSAEDADSIPPEHAHEPRPHKMEGAFYIWRDDEIQDVLGDDAAVFRARFGILPDGNAPNDPQGEFTEKNLLYTARSLDDVASITGRPVEGAMDALRRAAAPVDGAPGVAATSTPRRQSAHRLERADDRRLRTGSPHDRRRRGLSRGCPEGRAIRARAPVAVVDRDTAAALSGRILRCGRLRRGLCLLDLRSARIVPGRWRIPTGWSGQLHSNDARTTCSGIRMMADGSARPARMNRCCCASRRTTTVQSPRRAL